MRVGRWAANLLCAGVFVIPGGCRKEPPPVAPARPPIVTVSQPVVQEVVDYEDFTGQTAAVESVDVRARVGGYLEKIFFESGDEVKKDDVLFQIDPRPFQAELDRSKAELARTEAQLKIQEIEVERLNDLLKKQAASQIELARVVADRDAASAARDAAHAAVEQAQLNLDFTTIRAPISGHISRNYVDIGNLIQGGMGQAATTLLTTIVSVDPIYAYFDIDEQTVLRLRKRVREGQLKNYKQADIPVFLGLSIEEDYPHRGRIDFAENRLNSSTGTLNVRGIFENADRALSPGLFARIRIPIGKPTMATLVPERALGSDQGQRFVLVVNEKNVVEFHPIKVGRLHHGLRAIENGISGKDWIITNGLQRVRPGVTVEPKQEPVFATQSAPATTRAGG